MNPLLDETQQRHRDAARALASSTLEPCANEIDASGACPEAVLSAARTCLDEVDDALSAALRLEELAAVCSGVAMALSGHMAARALAGSAAEGLGAAIPSACGSFVAASEGESFRVAGEATMVPGAAYATTFFVPTEAGVFALAAEADGVVVGETELLLGLGGCGAASVRIDAVVAADARLDGVQAGQLENQVRLAHAAVALGVSQAALDAALAAVEGNREAGGRKGRTQAVQWMLADLATDTEAARLSLWSATFALGGPEATEAAASARLLAAEAAVKGARRAVQVAGAAGTRRGSTVERLYRDAKVLEVVGGSNEDQLRAIADEILPPTAH